jgi:hypothetical protein
MGKVLKDLQEMFEGIDIVFNTESVSSNISYKSFKTYLCKENSYCDHRNFDIVEQSLDRVKQ